METAAFLYTHLHTRAQRCTRWHSLKESRTHTRAGLGTRTLTRSRVRSHVNARTANTFVRSFVLAHADACADACADVGAARRELPATIHVHYGAHRCAQRSCYSRAARDHMRIYAYVRSFGLGLVRSCISVSCARRCMNRCTRRCMRRRSHSYAHA
jgi:hypothetical protein